MPSLGLECLKHFFARYVFLCLSNLDQMIIVLFILPHGLNHFGTRIVGLCAMSSEGELIEFTVGVDKLEGRWRRLVADIPTAGFTKDWWLDLKGRHLEPQRYYHTLEHLAELFSFLDSPFGANITADRRPLVEFTIFFHDAIYDPKSGTNEEDSAALWQQFAAEGSLSAETTETVRNWILWTKTHAAPEGTPEDALLWLDFDMAVLAKPWDSYYRYAAQVRQEFRHVPVEDYIKKRPAYFERQLSDTAHKFYLSRGLAHLEPRARRNLERECELLRSGHLPVLRPPGKRTSWFASDTVSSSSMVTAALIMVASVAACILWRQSRKR